MSEQSKQAETAYERVMRRHGYDPGQQLPPYAVFPTADLMEVLQEQAAQIRALRDEVAALKDTGVVVVLQRGEP